MKQRIMVVEDSEPIAELIRQTLSRFGYDVRVAMNGFEALRALDEIKPDLIISDINMPKLDGLKLCWAIKNRLETQDIPFILLSSQFDEETVKKGKELGARFFIAKPCEAKQVLECVKKSLDLFG